MGTSFPGTCLCQAAFNVLLFRGDTPSSSGKKELPLSLFRSEKWDSERLSSLLRVSQPALQPRSAPCSFLCPREDMVHFLGCSVERKGKPFAIWNCSKRELLFQSFGWIITRCFCLPLHLLFLCIIKYSLSNTQLNKVVRLPTACHSALEEGHDFCPSFSLPLSLLPLGLLLLRSFFQDRTNGLFLFFLYMLF